MATPLFLLQHLNKMALAKKIFKGLCVLCCVEARSTPAHLTMFEFGGHANLAGLSLLDIRASLDSPIYFPEWPAIEIGCIFVPKKVQICLQSSKIRPPNSNVDNCASVLVGHHLLDNRRTLYLVRHSQSGKNSSLKS